MADDAIALPDYVGWTAAHDVHVVGGSMGGMIALSALFYAYIDDPTQYATQKWLPRSLNASSP